MLVLAVESIHHVCLSTGDVNGGGWVVWLWVLCCVYTLCVFVCKHMCNHVCIYPPVHRVCAVSPSLFHHLHLHIPRLGISARLGCIQALSLYRYVRPPPCHGRSVSFTKTTRRTGSSGVGIQLFLIPLGACYTRRVRTNRPQLP